MEHDEPRISTPEQVLAHGARLSLLFAVLPSLRDVEELPPALAAVRNERLQAARGALCSALCSGIGAEKEKKEEAFGAGSGSGRSEPEGVTRGLPLLGEGGSSELPVVSVSGLEATVSSAGGAHLRQTLDNARRSLDAALRSAAQEDAGEEASGQQAFGSSGPAEDKSLSGSAGGSQPLALSGNWQPAAVHLELTDRPVELMSASQSPPRLGEMGSSRHLDLAATTSHPMVPRISDATLTILTTTTNTTSTSRNACNETLVSAGWTLGDLVPVPYPCTSQGSVDSTKGDVGDAVASGKPGCQQSAVVAGGRPDSRPLDDESRVETRSDLADDAGARRLSPELCADESSEIGGGNRTQEVPGEACKTAEVASGTPAVISSVSSGEVADQLLTVLQQMRQEHLDYDIRSLTERTATASFTQSTSPHASAEADVCAGLSHFQSPAASRNVTRNTSANTLGEGSGAGRASFQADSSSAASSCPQRDSRSADDTQGGSGLPGHAAAVAMNDADTDHLRVGDGGVQGGIAVVESHYSGSNHDASFIDRHAALFNPCTGDSTQLYDHLTSSVGQEAGKDTECAVFSGFHSAASFDGAKRTTSANTLGEGNGSGWASFQADSFSAASGCPQGGSSPADNTQGGSGLPVHAVVSAEIDAGTDHFSAGDGGSQGPLSGSRRTAVGESNYSGSDHDVSFSDRHTNLFNPSTADSKCFDGLLTSSVWQVAGKEAVFNEAAGCSGLSGSRNPECDGTGEQRTCAGSPGADTRAGRASVSANSSSAARSCPHVGSKLTVNDHGGSGLPGYPVAVAAAEIDADTNRLSAGDGDFRGPLGNSSGRRKGLTGSNCSGDDHAASFADGDSVPLNTSVGDSTCLDGLLTSSVGQTASKGGGSAEAAAWAGFSGFHPLSASGGGATRTTSANTPEAGNGSGWASFQADSSSAASSCNRGSGRPADDAQVGSGLPGPLAAVAVIDAGTHQLSVGDGGVQGLGPVSDPGSRHIAVDGSDHSGSDQGASFINRPATLFNPSTGNSTCSPPPVGGSGPGNEGHSAGNHHRASSPRGFMAEATRWQVASSHLSASDEQPVQAQSTVSYAPTRSMNFVNHEGSIASYHSGDNSQISSTTASDSTQSHSSILHGSGAGCSHGMNSIPVSINSGSSSTTTSGHRISGNSGVDNILAARALRAATTSQHRQTARRPQAAAPCSESELPAPNIACISPEGAILQAAEHRQHETQLFELHLAPQLQKTGLELHIQKQPTPQPYLQLRTRPYLQAPCMQQIPRLPQQPHHLQQPQHATTQQQQQFLPAESMPCSPVGLALRRGLSPSAASPNSGSSPSLSGSPSKTSQTLRSKQWILERLVEAGALRCLGANNSGAVRLDSDGCQKQLFARGTSPQESLGGGSPWVASGVASPVLGGPGGSWLTPLAVHSAPGAAMQGPPSGPGRDGAASRAAEDWNEVSELWSRAASHQNEEFASDEEGEEDLRRRRHLDGWPDAAGSQPEEASSAWQEQLLQQQNLNKQLKDRLQQQEQERREGVQQQEQERREAAGAEQKQQDLLQQLQDRLQQRQQRQQDPGSDQQDLVHQLQERLQQRQQQLLEAQAQQLNSTLRPASPKKSDNAGAENKEEKALESAVQAPPEPPGKGVAPPKGKGKGPPDAPPSPPKKGSAPALKGKGKGSPGSDGKGTPRAMRKPEVLPRTPLKKLFWSPINLGENSELTVWERIHQCGAKFDADELEALFGEAGASTARGQEAAQPRQPTALRRRRVLEEKRRRELWFMLALMPDLPQLLKALELIDDSLLEPEKVELLLINLPIPGEAELIRSAEATTPLGEGETWDSPEQFVLGMTSVNQYALRVRVWGFLLSFEALASRLETAERELRVAADHLQTSVRIEKLLGLVLFIGNYLNGGTARGRADGFDLEALPKLGKLRASGQSTLLDFLVSQAEKDTPGLVSEIFAEGAESESVARARRHRVPELQDELKSMITQAESYLQQMSSGTQATEPPLGDALLERKVQVQARLGRLQVTAAAFISWADRYASLCAWFHVNGKQRPTEEFFGFWDNLFSDLKKAWETQRREAVKIKFRSAGRASSPRPQGGGRAVAEEGAAEEEATPRRRAESLPPKPRGTSSAAEDRCGSSPESRVKAPRGGLGCRRSVPSSRPPTPSEGEGEEKRPDASSEGLTELSEPAVALEGAKLGEEIPGP